MADSTPDMEASQPVAGAASGIVERLTMPQHSQNNTAISISEKSKRLDHGIPRNVYIKTMRFHESWFFLLINKQLNNNKHFLSLQFSLFLFFSFFSLISFFSFSNLLSHLQNAFHSDLRRCRSRCSPRLGCPNRLGHPSHHRSQL